MSEAKKTRKIQARVWPSTMNALNRELRRLYIKRDGYLNALLGHETEKLAIEVDFRTPDDARRRIKRKLQELDPEDVTIALSPEVAKRMKEVLDYRNISRNAFINRVLFFLVARPDVLERLGVFYSDRIDIAVKPLEDARFHLQDPFDNIRASNDSKFYRLLIPDERRAKGWPSLFGLNCAIDAASWEELTAPPIVLEELF